MDNCLPSVIWIGESIPLEFEFGEGPTSGTFGAQYLGHQPSAPKGSVFKLSARLRRKQTGSTRFIGTLTAIAENPQGDYAYQVWSSAGRVKTNCFNGVFTLAANLTATNTITILNDDGTVDTSDAPTTTAAERQLATLEQKIFELLSTGVQAFTLSGNSTTRVSLQALYRERSRLFEVVNRERRARGLPFLPGTIARIKQRYSAQ